MNHCVECGARVERGHTRHPDTKMVRCLVCIVKRDMQTFQYKSRASQLRALGKQAEQQGGRR